MIVLDVRCLQDENYASRGVGRHAFLLLRELRRRATGFRLCGLTDPAMPPLGSEPRAELELIHFDAYAATQPNPPDCLIDFSPMTHDQACIARLLGDDRILRVGVVYDFIPHRCPDRYLSTPARRLEYTRLLHWLSLFDLYCPISDSAAQDVVSLLGVESSRVHVTGCALGPAFEASSSLRHGLERTHILVVGGGDLRKNPEVVVRAHGCSAVLQREGVPLLIVGNYGQSHQRELERLAAQHGGRADLVRVLGHVSDDDLADLYRSALAVVAPSRDEGFSLPVIEAMALGAVCLVSSIPAHRELISNVEQVFAPDDHARLTIALEHVATDLGLRSRLRAAQDAIWPRFRAASVAERLWLPVAAGLAARDSIRRPAISRRARPRVAVLTPLPPDRSGVADYTAAMCVELGRVTELHLFSETERPTPILNVRACNPMSEVAGLTHRFDRVVSVLGNSQYHVRYFDYLRNYGGCAIAHDARMTGFYRAMLGLEPALREASAELGRQVSEAEFVDWLVDEGRTKALLLGEIARHATPMVVHSVVTANEVVLRHGVCPAYVPFSIYRPWISADIIPAVRLAARQRLGIAADEVAVATFGIIHETKGPAECIWALWLLRSWGVPARLYFVGQSLDDLTVSTLRDLAIEADVSESVVLGSDYVSENEYRDFLIGADLAIQLRAYTLGGLSGAVLDCAAAGLPTVSNFALAQTVGVPSGYNRTVPDHLSPVLIAGALHDLLDAKRSSESRSWSGEREAFCHDRSMSKYAMRLCEVLDLDAGQGSNLLRDRQ